MWLLWLIWFIIKIPFLLLYYLGIGIVYIIILIVETRSNNKEFESYLSSLTQVNLDTICNYTPLKIGKGLIKKTELEVKLSWGGYIKTKTRIKNEMLFLYCKSSFYNARFLVSLYNEGVIIKFKRKYYLVPFEKTICTIDKLYKETDLEFDPIIRLKQIVENDIRYYYHEQFVKELDDTRHYTKNGELDKRYSKQNQQDGGKLYNYTEEFYLFSGKYSTTIQCGIVKICFIQDMESAYEIAKEIFCQLNKEIPILTDMISEPSDTVALLTPADKKEVIKFLSQGSEIGNDFMELDAEELYDRIIEQRKKRFVRRKGKIMYSLPE